MGDETWGLSIGSVKDDTGTHDKVGTFPYNLPDIHPASLDMILRGREKIFAFASHRPDSFE